MGRDSGPAKRTPQAGRDWGRGDYRVPRPYETAVDPAKYREQYDRIQWDRKPARPGYTVTVRGRGRDARIKG